jgi:hypothetical protein
MTNKEYDRLTLFLKEYMPHHKGWHGWFTLQKEYVEKNQISQHQSIVDLSLKNIFKGHHHKYVQQITLWILPKVGNTKYF